MPFAPSNSTTTAHLDETLNQAIISITPSSNSTTTASPVNGSEPQGHSLTHPLFKAREGELIDISAVHILHALHILHLVRTVPLVPIHGHVDHVKFYLANVLLNHTYSRSLIGSLDTSDVHGLINKSAYIITVHSLRS